MGKINAGDLTERVTLLTTGPAYPDGRGGHLPSGPPTQKTVWANVRQLSAREFFAIGQVTSTKAYAVTIRYLAGVIPRQQVVYQGVVLSVQAVQADRRKEFLILTCFDSGKYAPGPVTGPIISTGTYPATYQSTY